MLKKKEKALYIQKKLSELYPNPKAPLNHSNAFTLLIAVLLSAQTTDKRVNIVTKELFKKASSPEKMLKLGEKKVYEYIKTCGLAPKKAKAIIGTSKILLKKYKGKVPKELKLLEELPGVGHKTASVVISQGFGHPAFPVDTHIHRLAQRWGLTKGKNVGQTERDLKKIFPKDSWNKLHLQIIFWGREFCQAQQCHGITCKICKATYPKRSRPFSHNKP